MAERMADRIAAVRRRQFVGRAAELALVGSLLTAEDAGAVVFLYGPGGVGKTTLLRQIASLGSEAGRLVLRLESRDVPPIPASVLAALAAAAGCDPAVEPLPFLASLDDLLILVDTGELLAPLDRWLREDLLPALAADTIVVLAGREPPSLAWRTDPGWSGLVHPVRLSNLSDAESRSLLRLRGVPDSAQAGALAFTGGHPLALALVADVLAQGAESFTPAATPGVVTVLLATLIETVPSALHRAALEACAQVLTTTESLLAALLEVEDARDVFDWLRGLSIIEAGPRGLYPHEVAREALAAELRWRHPEQHASIHRRAGAYYRDHFYAFDVSQQQQVLVDYVFLHRSNPILGPFVSSSAGSGMDLRSMVASQARDSGERAVARAMVERHEGPESAALFDHWMARQPESLLLVRAADGDVLGLIATIDVARATAQDRAVDPAVERAWVHLSTLEPLAPGEVAGFFRFWMQADGYQSMGPVQMFITLHFVRYYLATPRLAQSFVAYADVELWGNIAAYAEVPRVPDGDFTVGGRSYGLFTHDWRSMAPLAWLEILGDREVAEEPLAQGASTSVAPTPTGISRSLTEDEFSAAVRTALRGLGRSDGLRGSPLLSAPLVTRRQPGTMAEAEDVLRAAFREAAARMEASPGDRRAFRALHHTYLLPAQNQAKAAELLDLPTTTYRRHLTLGVERITQLLRQADADAR
ncbi:MAG: AAA family ATPase [Micropruina sp.]|nr:AAA family ATPase [Micropruina sp.]